MRPLHLVAIAAILASVLMTAKQTPVLAGQPVTQPVSIDRTFEAPFFTRACGFTVSRHEVRNYTLATFSDGTQATVLTGPNYDTFTGMSGASVTRHLAGIDTVSTNLDGTTTSVDVGNFGLITVPGSGVVLGQAGRLVTVTDQGGHVLSETFTGTIATSDLATICAYLGS